ncbi:hypothetical protein Taro_008143, partial [Colocasia esculenta]|nr:hypothetical protein [Colocasia esculenta]
QDHFCDFCTLHGFPEVGYLRLSFLNRRWGASGWVWTGDEGLDQRWGYLRLEIWWTGGGVPSVGFGLEAPPWRWAKNPKGGEHHKGGQGLERPKRGGGSHPLPREGERVYDPWRWGGPKDPLYANTLSPFIEVRELGVNRSPPHLRLESGRGERTPPLQLEGVTRDWRGGPSSWG